MALAIVSALSAGCSEAPEPEAQSANPDEAFLQSVRGEEADDAAPTPEITDPAAVAKIELPTDRYDMGVIENYEIAVQKMPVYNRGTAPLKITRVSTSCGCTSGEMETSVIPPGGEGNLIIRVDPARIPGFFAEKVLTLYTNDPTNPSPSLHVATHVKPEVELVPEVLDFGKIPVKHSGEFTARIRQLQDDAVEIKSAALGRDVTAITIESKLAPENEWAVPGKREFIITVKIAPGAPVGIYDETIWVNTNITRYANIPLKFRGEILGPYSVTPRAVAVRNLEPGITQQGVLFIQSEKPMKVTGLTNSNSAVTTAFQAGEQPNTFTFNLSVPERTPNRAIRDTWTITMDVDGEQFVETVPVTIILTKAG